MGRALSANGRAMRQGFNAQPKTSSQILAELIEKAVFAEDGLVDYCMQNWHTRYQHQSGQDAGKPINRLLQWPDKPADAVFISNDKSQDPMRTAIERLFLDNSEKIADWMLSDDKKDLSLSFRMENDDNEKIGIGVKRIKDRKTGHERFIEVECHDARMFLTKTSTRRGFQLWNLDFGIAMKTVYPDAMAPSSVPTGRDLIPDVLASLAFSKSKDPAQKREWLAAAGCKDPDSLLKGSSTGKDAPSKHPTPRYGKDPTASCLSLAEEIRSRSRNRAAFLESP